MSSVMGCANFWLVYWWLLVVKVFKFSPFHIMCLSSSYVSKWNVYIVWKLLFCLNWVTMSEVSLAFVFLPRNYSWAFSRYLGWGIPNYSINDQVQNWRSSHIDLHIILSLGDLLASMKKRREAQPLIWRSSLRPQPVVAKLKWGSPVREPPVRRVRCVWLASHPQLRPRRKIDLISSKNLASSSSNGMLMTSMPHFQHEKLQYFTTSCPSAA